jgi:hypothetical protein
MKAVKQEEVDKFLLSYQEKRIVNRALKDSGILFNGYKKLRESGGQNEDRYHWRCPPRR